MFIAFRSRCSLISAPQNHYTDKPFGKGHMNHSENVEMKLMEMLSNRPRAVSETALELRRLISKLAPDSSELLYKTYAVSNVFTYTGKLGQAFLHVATYAKHVNLGFNQGSRISDPEGLLHGNGKLIRHIRIDQIDDAKDKKVRRLIEAAIELGIQMAENAGGIQDQIFQVKSQ